MRGFLQKMGSDANMMAHTVSELPHETRRAMLIVSVSVTVIGGLVFWPDIPSVIGFSVVTILLLCAFVTLSANGIRCSFDDEDAPLDESVEEPYGNPDDDPSDWL